MAPSAAADTNRVAVAGHHSGQHWLTRRGPGFGRRPGSAALLRLRARQAAGGLAAGIWSGFIESTPCVGESAGSVVRTGRRAPPRNRHWNHRIRRPRPVPVTRRSGAVRSRASAAATAAGSAERSYELKQVKVVARVDLRNSERSPSRLRRSTPHVVNVRQDSRACPRYPRITVSPSASAARPVPGQPGRVRRSRGTAARRWRGGRYRSGRRRAPAAAAKINTPR